MRARASGRPPQHLVAVCNEAFVVQTDGGRSRIAQASYVTGHLGLFVSAAIKPCSMVSAKRKPSPSLLPGGMHQSGWTWSSEARRGGTQCSGNDEWFGSEAGTLMLRFCVTLIIMALGSVATSQIRVEQHGNTVFKWGTSLVAQWVVMNRRSRRWIQISSCVDKLFQSTF